MNSSKRLLTADSIEGFRNLRNYIENSDAVTNTAGWSMYADAAAAPVDGQGGSPTATFARSTTSPLRLASNFLYTPTATLGQGAAYSFTLDRADLARVLRVSFDYEINTYTSYTDGDLSVYIISASDSGFTTNLQVVQTVPFKILKVGNQETFSSEFQTHASNLYYKLCIHQVTAAASYTMKIGNLYLGAEPAIASAPVTVFRARKSSQSGLTGGSWNTISFASGDVSTDSAGAWSTDTFTVKTPGYYRISGFGSGNTAGAATKYILVGYRIDLGSDISMGQGTNTSATGGGAAGADIVRLNAGQTIQYRVALETDTVVNVPTFQIELIGGPSGTTPEARVIAMSAVKGSGAHTLTGSYQAVASWTTSFDNNSSFNATTGVYTVQTQGKYHVHGTIAFSASATTAGVKVQKNGSDAFYGYIGAISGSISNGLPFSGVIDCNVGDTITVLAYQNSGANLNYGAFTNASMLSIDRLSGPVSVAASEVIVVRATNTSGQSIAASASETTITNWTAGKDTHGAFNTTSGTFTAPAQGDYILNAQFMFASGTSWSANSFTYAAIFKNGSLYAYGEIFTVQTAFTNSNSAPMVRINDVVSLNAGDTVTIKLAQNEGTTRALRTLGGLNILTISKV